MTNQILEKPQNQQVSYPFTDNGTGFQFCRKAATFNKVSQTAFQAEGGDSLAAQEGSLDQQIKCFSSDTLSKTREKTSLHTPVSGFLFPFFCMHTKEGMKTDTLYQQL